MDLQDEPEAHGRSLLPTSSSEKSLSNAEAASRLRTQNDILDAIEWSYGSVIGFYCVLLFFDLVLVATLRSSESTVISVIFSGVVSAQIALVVIFGSLTGDNWLEGILIECAAGLGILLFCWLPIIDKAGFAPSGLSFLAALPAMALIISLPLLSMRWWFGWRLLRGLYHCFVPERMSIESMILVPAALMTIFWAAKQASQFITDQFINSPVMFLGLAGPLAIICLIAVLPEVYWFFRIDDREIAWTACLGYLFAWTLGSLVFFYFISSGRLPPQGVGLFLVFMGTVSLVGLFGLHIFRSAGYRLVSYASVRPSNNLSSTKMPGGGATPAAKVADTNPFDLEPKTKGSRSYDRQAARRTRFRIAVSALVLGTALMNGLAWIGANAVLDQVLTQIKADGGIVETLNGNIVSIDFGPQNVERHLNNLPASKTLRDISLNRTAIGYVWQVRKFPSLRTLDLRNTNVIGDEIAAFPISNVTLTVWQDQFTAIQIQRLNQRGYTLKAIPR